LNSTGNVVNYLTLHSLVVGVVQYHPVLLPHHGGGSPNKNANNVNPNSTDNVVNYLTLNSPVIRVVQYQPVLRPHHTGAEVLLIRMKPMLTLTVLTMLSAIFF
jgi:hypothetical protein